MYFINTITHSSANFGWCALSRYELGLLLHSCPRLTDFQFKLAELPDDPNSVKVPLAPRDLLKTLLRTHSHTLKSFHVNFYPFHSLQTDAYRDFLMQSRDLKFPYYRSFRKFEKLEHMSVEFNRVRDFTQLPASLKSIKVSLCILRDLTKQIIMEDLVKLKQTTCPEIESIILEGQEDTNERLLQVQDKAVSLGHPVQLSAGGRTLTISGAGCVMQVQSFRDSLYGKEYFRNSVLGHLGTIDFEGSFINADGTEVYFDDDSQDDFLGNKYLRWISYILANFFPSRSLFFD